MSVKRIEKSQKFGYSVVLEEDESGNKYKAFLSDNANYIFDLQRRYDDLGEQAK